MKYTISKLPKSRVSVFVEHSTEELARAKERAMETLAKHTHVEGFRPGKAPKDVVAGRLDSAAVLEEAGFSLLNQTFREIVGKEHLDVIGEPSAQILKLAEGNVFSYRVEVDVVPAIVLPDYRTIASKIKKRSSVIEEKEVEGALAWLQEQRKNDGGTLPELTDEFAKSLGGFESLGALRASIREGLAKEKQTLNSQIARQEALEKITLACRFDVPASMLERERRSIAERAQNAGEQSKTKEELEASFAKEAERRVRSFLVLREIAKKESLAPTKEEVDREVNAILQKYSNAPAPEHIDPAQLRLYTEEVLTNEKTFQFLETYIPL